MSLPGNKQDDKKIMSLTPGDCDVTLHQSRGSGTRRIVIAKQFKCVTSFWIFDIFWFFNVWDQIWW